MSKQLQATFSCLALAAGLFAGGCSGSSTSPMGAPSVTDNGAGSASNDGTGGNGATATGGGSTATPDPTPSPAPTTPTTPAVPSHHRCAWLNDDVALGTASLIANADFFDAVHPYFWTLTGGGNVAKTSFTDDATIVSTAR